MWFIIDKMSTIMILNVHFFHAYVIPDRMNETVELIVSICFRASQLL